MPAQYYWGGPEMLAKGERSRRQLAAMSSLAGAPGKMVRNYGDYAQQESREGSLMAQLQARLGNSEQKVQAQAAPQDDASVLKPGSLGPVPPPASTLEGQGGSSIQDMPLDPAANVAGDDSTLNARRSVHSNDAGGASLGDYARAAAATIFGAYVPKASREQEIGRMQGTVQGRQDRIALGRSLGPYWTRMKHPEKAVQGLYPWAPYLAQETIPPRQPGITQSQIEWLAAQGDPMKALQLHQQYSPQMVPMTTATSRGWEKSKDNGRSWEPTGDPALTGELGMPGLIFRQATQSARGPGRPAPPPPADEDTVEGIPLTR